MLNKLFSSKARVEVLKLFLFNPADHFYQRQISLLTHQPIRAIQRELKRLQELGLIDKFTQANHTFYKVNTDCPIFEELKNILFKCTGIAQVLRKNLIKTDIQIAFIYGSYAKNEESLLSDIDLFVIGSISTKELSRFLAQSKKEFNREINYMVFSITEFKKRLKQKDHFLNTIVNEKKIFIVGNENELTTLIRSR
jgi:predicted nucleotidyltransferase